MSFPALRKFCYRAVRKGHTLFNIVEPAETQSEIRMYGLALRNGSEVRVYARDLLFYQQLEGSFEVA